MSIATTTARQRKRVHSTMRRVHRRVLQDHVAEDEHVEAPTASERLCNQPAIEAAAKAVERINVADRQPVAPVLRNGNRSASPLTISNQLDSDVSRRVSPVAERQGYETREYLGEEAETDLEESTANEGDRSPTFADVLRTFEAEYRRRNGRTMTVQQDRALRQLAACYTPLMGTHQWSCDGCGATVDLPNSCKNRNCPTCGDSKRREWAETTKDQLLPVEHHHVILTVPHEITLLAIANPGVVYPIMLRTGAEAIKRCGRKLFDVDLALLSLLHSWGSVLNDHLHSHSLLPAGGLWVKGLKWIDLSHEQIEQLLEMVSTKFPELFLKALRKEYDQGKLTFDNEPELEGLECPAAFAKWLDPVSDIRWIIRCPQVWDRRRMKHDPDATAKTVEYLAKYANRVAVSNSRLVGIEGSNVLLRYKDYRDEDTWKTMPIDGVEFIGRFLRHLLPPKMHHIRRYGWMARRAKNEKLTWLRDRFDMPALDSDEDDQATDDEDVESQAIPEAPSRPCRYCQSQGAGEIQGKMYLTGATYRPKISEILRMPLEWFREARAGAIVTLGENVKDVAKLTGKETRRTAGSQASGRPPPTCDVR